MTQKHTSFSAFVTEWKPKIETALDTATRKKKGEPDRLFVAMRYSLLSGGKRLRPLLCLLAAKACGANPAVALNAGCAVEMVHAFSLIHDDLPCMDDDDLRRGEPTNHKVYGEAMALLAGDALLAHAFTMLSDTDSTVCLASATTEMIEGQVLDMTAGEQAGITQEFLDTLNGKKTGALLCAALELGAIAAKASDAKRQTLRSYGSLVGLAFQITDDLLDVTGDQQLTGKKVGKDAEKGKKTYPIVIGVEQSHTRARELVDEACVALAPLGSNVQEFEEFARSLLDRTA